MAEEKPKSFLQQFREFVSRGNVVDLAVGIIIGSAFNQIVNSLVKDLVMPPIGLLLGKVNLSDLKFVLQNAGTTPTGRVLPEVAITYGAFLQSLLNFLIIACTVFLLIKAFTAIQEFEKNRLRKEEPKVQKVQPETELDVLKDIRNSLRKSRK